MITLEPLSQSESRELMVNLLGQVELSAELVEKIGAAAEGNPLFVEEMVGMLIDTGFLERRNGGWSAVSNVAEVAVPPTIQALLAARLDGLPAAERTVIERGAVEGKIFHRGAVAELAPDELREAVPAHLRALSRKELVRPDRSDFAGDEGFRFRHLLIRDAAYTAMPKEARADLHARFAIWLERMAGEHLSEYEEIVGYHLEQAHRYRTELGPIDDESRRLGAEAARHLAASGDRASARGDVPAAVKLLSAALDLMPLDVHARFPLAGRLGMALNYAGELRRAEALMTEEMERARAMGDELGAAYPEIVRLDVRSAFGQVSIGEVILRSSELLDVFENAGDEWGANQAGFELSRHQFFSGHAAQALETIEGLMARYLAGKPPLSVVYPIFGSLFWGPTPFPEAVRRAQEIDTSSSRQLEAAMDRFRGGCAGMVGDFEAGRQLLRRAVEIEREFGRMVMADAALGHFLGPLEKDAGNYAEAESILVATYERMAARGDKSFSSTVAGNIADLYIEMNRWDDAEQYARITLETSTADDVVSQTQGATALARILAVRGEIAAAEASASRALAIIGQTDYVAQHGRALVGQAEVQLVAGKRVEAVESLRGAAELFEAKGATVHLARARARLAEIEQA
jgi:tetratricopeptide (TPR) repeat protein